MRAASSPAATTICCDCARNASAERRIHSTLWRAVPTWRAIENRWSESVVRGRIQLRSTACAVHLRGRGVGCFLAPRGRLGLAPERVLLPDLDSLQRLCRRLAPWLSAARRLDAGSPIRAPMPADVSGLLESVPLASHVLNLAPKGRSSHAGDRKLFPKDVVVE